ncbi:M48 family metallopeptidase [Chitinimonas sp. BJB300]|uniref:M48 family metallopeptidase n=1 Tax=Chitinimonas sp. BJB300 TaxID=1559339 RepID=UPI000C0E6F09|nr:M48 family metallopeptidase [Chitinimonas sp. BJB300]PHV10861.1 peptidase M48 [Chitinimonas sp. BJB300]TSJ91326.1 M48 family metallopeptidase [Chitinimonas sp. BJB300]
MLKRRLSLLGLGVSILLGACQQVNTTESGAIGVSRKQTMFSMLSSAQVDQMAAESYSTTLTQAQKKGILNNDSAMTSRVKAVAKRLIPQVAVFRKDALAWKWEVNVEDSPELNAYCAPGGKIMFYTGIIEKLKLNDDEIAAIMGHEMAHALREHGRERMSKAYAQQMGAKLLSAVTQGQYDGYIGLASKVTDVAYNLPNSRQNESEADAMGIELAARAGYDPAAAIVLWQKMSAGSKGQPPQFLSTHPSNETRISELQANIPKVMPLYQAARKKS